MINERTNKRTTKPTDNVSEEAYFSRSRSLFRGWRQQRRRYVFDSQPAGRQQASNPPKALGSRLASSAGGKQPTGSRPTSRSVLSHQRRRAGANNTDSQSEGGGTSNGPEHFFLFAARSKKRQPRPHDADRSSGGLEENPRNFDLRDSHGKDREKPDAIQSQAILPLRGRTHALTLIIPGPFRCVGSHSIPRDKKTKLGFGSPGII